MTFARLRAADWVAMVAALALLFVMAMDWYSSTVGNDARRIERIAEPRGGAGGELERETRDEAREVAAGEERNAWQASAGIDRLILMMLLATAGMSIAAGFARAADWRFQPPFTPSAATGVGAVLGALLVTYRILQEPGADVRTTVESGAPIAVAVLAVLALACAAALRAEQPDQRAEP